nr:ribonuclease H-like domain-containing protein [Tanacetum cinerariifolium]
MLDSQVNDMNKSCVGYYAVPPPYTRNFIPPKPDLILADVDEYVVSKSVTSVPAVAINEAKTSESKPKSVSKPLIEDWVSDSEDENETETKHMTGNMSYLFEHEEINDGYVAFEGDFKGGKITVPRKDNMYNVDLKNVVSQGETKDETSRILKAFITRIENLIDHKVKIIRCDNGTEFKNKEMNQFYEKQGIKREFSVARTPQQNRVAERKNKILIKATRTMLADLKLSTTFWAEVVNTACYVQNKGINLMVVQVKLEWRQYLTKIIHSYHYGLKIHYSLLVLKDSPGDGFKPSWEEEKKDVEDPGNEDNEVLSTEEPRVNQEKNANVNNTNNINTVSPTANTASTKDNVVDENIVYGCADDPNMPNLEEIVYSDEDEDVGAEADMTNLDTNIPFSLMPITKIHKDHLVKQIIRDIHSAPQIRRITKSMTDHDFKLTDESHVLLKVHRKDNMYNVDLKNVVSQGGITCLFAKATLDESNLWHKSLGYIIFKTMNKLEKGVIDSRCSRHMTGNMSYLSEHEEINDGYVAFEGDLKGGKITGKGKISTDWKDKINHSDTFSDSNNDDDISIDDNAFEDIEYVEASLSDPELVNVEEKNVVQQEEKEVDFEDISQIQDVVLREKLLSITRLISNIESLNNNPTPDRVLNSFESDNSLLDNFSSEFETFCDHSEETRSEGVIRFLEELVSNDSILSHESSDSNFEDNPSNLRPPPEPPNDNFDLEPEVILAVIEDIDEPDEHFNPGGEIFVSTNNED